MGGYIVPNMEEVTVYHVTHEDNVESIMESGLEPSPSINHSINYVFVTRTEQDAEEVKDAYYAGPEAVVIKADTYEEYLFEDPDPHGDLNSFAHEGPIYPPALEVLDD